MGSHGTLYFFCGKMAAGKSTLARDLAQRHGAILLSEDEWLGQLFGEEIETFADYIRYSARLKPLLKPHVQSLLRSGLSVVMDFPGNTRRQRAWFRDIVSEHDLPHRLHSIEATDALCLAQLRRRSQSLPEGAPFTSEEEFHHVTRYFEPPGEDEGFTIEVHRREG